MIPPARLAGFVNTLKQSKSIVLLCHRKPDGDAVGAMLGLHHLLHGQGIVTTPVCLDPVPQHYRFLPGSERVVSTIPRETDLLVILDCGSDRLTGLSTAELQAVAPIVEIDHHPKPRRLPSPRLGLYDPDASSTAEIVYEIAETLEWPVSREAATALLTGIVTDTTAFQTTNTSAQTLRTAAALLRHGARLKTITRECFYSSSVPKLRLWGTAMSRIEQGEPSGVVSTVVTAEDLADADATPDDLEGLVNFLNAIPNVPALMLLTDMREGEVKGSMRTRDNEVDVSQLARQLGGGGHTKAAGFTVPGRLERQADDRWRLVPPS